VIPVTIQNRPADQLKKVRREVGLRQSDWLLARVITSLAIPEPSTWAMMILGSCGPRALCRIDLAITPRLPRPDHQSDRSYRDRLRAVFLFGQLQQSDKTGLAAETPNNLIFQVDNGIATFNVAAVPEPSTWAMMILGFVGVGFMAYRQEVPPGALV
jgi:hypothetical protein